MIAIRNVTEADADLIRAILNASIRHLCAIDHNDDPAAIAAWLANKTPENIAGWIANPDLTLFLALRDGAPAGIGGYFGHGELVLNYVDPAHRFRGVSRAVLAHFEEQCRQLGLRIGKLASTRTAHRFYLDAGWRDAGEPASKHGGVSHPMEKAFMKERECIHGTPD